MSTYFLVGSKLKFVKEPKDEFLHFPIKRQTSKNDTSVQSTVISASNLNSPSSYEHLVRQNTENGTSVQSTPLSNSCIADHTALKIKVKSSTCALV